MSVTPTGVIPMPPAEGPDPGQPGHFAHHDWLEQAVLALDSGSASGRMPGIMLVINVATTLTSGVHKCIPFNGPYTGLNAPPEMWTSAAPTRIIAPIEGRYAVAGSAPYATNATGFRQTSIIKNGNGVLTAANIMCNNTISAIASPAVPSPVVAITDLYMAAGDYVEFDMYQNSGGTLSVGYNGGLCGRVGMTYLGPV